MHDMSFSFKADTSSKQSAILFGEAFGCVQEEIKIGKEKKENNVVEGKKKKETEGGKKKEVKYSINSYE